ncbi:MAG: hypothetical protein AB1540_11885 [Bdellovibrionota bacterium]
MRFKPLTLTKNLIFINVLLVFGLATVIAVTAAEANEPSENQFKVLKEQALNVKARVPQEDLDETLRNGTKVFQLNLGSRTLYLYADPKKIQAMISRIQRSKELAPLESVDLVNMLLAMTTQTTLSSAQTGQPKGELITWSSAANQSGSGLSFRDYLEGKTTTVISPQPPVATETSAITVPEKTATETAALETSSRPAKEYTFEIPMQGRKNIVLIGTPDEMLDQLSKHAEKTIEALQKHPSPYADEGKQPKLRFDLSQVQSALTVRIGKAYLEFIESRKELERKTNPIKWRRPRTETESWAIALSEWFAGKGLGEQYQALKTKVDHAVATMWETRQQIAGTPTTALGVTTSVAKLAAEKLAPRQTSAGAAEAKIERRANSDETRLENAVAKETSFPSVEKTPEATSGFELNPSKGSRFAFYAKNSTPSSSFSLHAALEPILSYLESVDGPQSVREVLELQAPKYQVSTVEEGKSPIVSWRKPRDSASPAPPSIWTLREWIEERARNDKALLARYHALKAKTLADSTVTSPIAVTLEVVPATTLPFVPMPVSPTKPVTAQTSQRQASLPRTKEIDTQVLSPYQSPLADLTQNGRWGSDHYERDWNRIAPRPWSDEVHETRARSLFAEQAILPEFLEADETDIEDTGRKRRNPIRRPIDSQTQSVAAVANDRPHFIEAVATHVNPPSPRAPANPTQAEAEWQPTVSQEEVIERLQAFERQLQPLEARLGLVGNRIDSLARDLEALKDFYDRSRSFEWLLKNDRTDSTARMINRINRIKHHFLAEAEVFVFNGKPDPYWNEKLRWEFSAAGMRRFKCALLLSR